MSQLSRAIARHRKGVLAIDRRAANLMAQEYGKVYSVLSASLDTLTEEMLERQLAGKELTESWLLKNARTQSLLAQVRAELERFTPYASKKIGEAVESAARLAVEHSEELLRLAPGPVPASYEIPAGFGRFNPKAIEEIVGRISGNSPLVNLLEPLGTQAVEIVRSTLIEKAVLGQGPMAAARSLKDELKIPLHRAETIARTETLGAYREASLETYEEAEIVEQWEWVADLSTATCPVCISMNGRRFPITTKFGTHPNCRCTTIPVTPSWEELGFEGLPDTRPETVKGSEWFERLSDVDKREILGTSKFNAYKEGGLTLEDTVGYRVDKAWGPTRWERSLRDIQAGKNKPPKAAFGK